MELKISIPDDLLNSFHEAFGDDLSRVALEILALEVYRTGKLSREQVQRLLGFADRYETRQWLSRKGFTESISAVDIEAERQANDAMNELTALSQEMGLYDPPFDNPLVKKN